LEAGDDVADEAGVVVAAGRGCVGEGVGGVEAGAAQRFGEDGGLGLGQEVHAHPGAALAQRFGGWTASLAIGETRLGPVAGLAAGRETQPEARLETRPETRLGGDARASRAVLRLDRQFGALALGLAGERVDERGALFGSRLAAPFGVTGGTTSSAALHAHWQHGGWMLSGEARIGTTSADLTGNGLFQRLSGLASTAARFSLTRAGVFGADSLSLTVAQPLRAGGAALLALGGDTPETVRLAPSGREIATEIGYARALGAGWLSLGLFWRNEPGHIAGTAPDAGGAVRFRLGL